MKTLFKVLAWFGRPFAPPMNMATDGVLFSPDGRTWTDTSEYRPANRSPADNYQSIYQVGASGRLLADCSPHHRMPAAPDGFHFISGTDQLTGWPYYQLKRNEEES